MDFNKDYNEINSKGFSRFYNCFRRCSRLGSTEKELLGLVLNYLNIQRQGTDRDSKALEVKIDKYVTSSYMGFASYHSLFQTSKKLINADFLTEMYSDGNYYIFTLAGEVEDLVINPIILLSEIDFIIMSKYLRGSNTNKQITTAQRTIKKIIKDNSSSYIKQLKDVTTDEKKYNVLSEYLTFLLDELKGAGVLIYDVEVGAYIPTQNNTKKTDSFKKKVKVNDKYSESMFTDPDVFLSKYE